MKADFALTIDWTKVTVIVESRSGRRGGPAERNPDYDQRVEAVLAAAARVGGRLIEVRIESEPTVRQRPRPSDRSICWSGGPPVVLAAVPAHELRRDIGRAVRQYSVGNNQKRIALVIEFDASFQGGAEALLAMMDP